MGRMSRGELGWGTLPTAGSLDQDIRSRVSGDRWRARRRGVVSCVSRMIKDLSCVTSNRGRDGMRVLNAVE